jgi:formylglycine-generating enzyme required for sulfatase activity
MRNEKGRATWRGRIGRVVLVLGALAAVMPPLAGAQGTSIEELERRLQRAKEEKARRDAAAARAREEGEAERKRKEAEAGRAAAERKAQEARLATVVVQTDAPCALSMNGEALGQIPVGISKHRVSPGQKLVSCASSEEKTSFEGELEARSGQDTVLRIALAAEVEGAQVRRRAEEQARREAEERARAASRLGQELMERMVVLEPGRFVMGSPAGEAGRDDDEGPQRTVSIGYRLAVGSTDVTRREFGVFVSATGYRTEAERDAGRATGCWTFEGGVGKYRSGRNWRNPGFEQGEDHPVVCLSWNDAQAYVKWLNEAGNLKGWRLLSEAEWEYAARAGVSTRYPWGDDVRNDQQCGHANGADRTAKARVPSPGGMTVADCDDGHAYTAPVRSFQANRWGLHDMQGNAWEWVQDCYDPKANGGKAPSDGKAYEALSCEQRVLRGGGWNDGPRGLRPADRNRSGPDNRFSFIGFRLARTAL